MNKKGIINSIGRIAGISTTMLIGGLWGVYTTQAELEVITGLRIGDFKSLVENCEVSLPRDKFCKLEIKAVEE